MTPERLQAYKEFVYKAKQLSIEIEKMRRELKRISRPSYVASPVLDGLPRSGHVSDPTARIAVQELSGAIPPHAAELHRQIEEKEDSLEDIKLEIREIDSWLEWLPERERWVVTEHLIEGNPWRTVIYKYKLTFGEEYSKDTLARLQRAALARS